MIDVVSQFRTKLDRLKELHGKPVYLLMDKNGAGNINVNRKPLVIFAVEGKRNSIDEILDECIERATG